MRVLQITACIIAYTGQIMEQRAPQATPLPIESIAMRQYQSVGITFRRMGIICVRTVPLDSGVVRRAIAGALSDALTPLGFHAHHTHPTHHIPAHRDYVRAHSPSGFRGGATGNCGRPYAIGISCAPHPTHHIPAHRDYVRAQQPLWILGWCDEQLRAPCRTPLRHWDFMRTKFGASRCAPTNL
jgi:hypothetical protein